jgi:hypothetical protein
MVVRASAGERNYSHGRDGDSSADQGFFGQVLGKFREPRHVCAEPVCRDRSGEDTDITEGRTENPES